MRTLLTHYPNRRVATILGALGMGVALLTPAANAATTDTTPAPPPSITILGPVVHYSHQHEESGVMTPEGRYCTPGTYSQIDSSQYVFYYDGHTWFRDGPGGTVSGSVTKATTISATISASATISIDALISDASATVSASVTKATTTTVGHTYTHNITAGKYGNMQYGVWGYNVRWSQWRMNSNCTTNELAKGTGTVPIQAQGWNYFEN